MSSTVTAIDYLVESIFNESELQDPILKLAITLAKEIEKEQIENAYFEGADACDVELEGERYFLVKPCSLSGGALYYALTYGI